MTTRPGRHLVSPPVLRSVGLFLVLGALCMPGTAEAEPYRSQYVADLPFAHLVTNTLTHDSRRLPYSLSIQRAGDAPIGNLARAYDPAWVQARLGTIWSFMDAYLADLGLPNRDCQTGVELNLFIIARAQMGEGARFLEFKRTFDMLDYVIQAFYDPTPEVPGNSALILSAVGDEPADSDLVHEFAHYWYDRVCGRASFGEESEPFAKRFEYYVQDRKQR